MNLYRLEITSRAKRELKAIFPERKKREVLEAILDLREDATSPQSETGNVMQTEANSIRVLALN